VTTRHLYGGIRRREFCCVVAGLALLCGGPAWADTAVVTIDNFTFTPAVLTVKPGTTVTFEIHDDIPHSIVGAAGKFRSRALDTGDRFSFTFVTAGDVDYFCGLHPHMKGRIVVAP
jgi:plastocyanin